MSFETIAILLVFAGLFGVIAKFFKQPAIIGYLFAGVALSALGILGNAHLLDEFGTIGVSLLLFLLGIEMKFDDISRIGKTALTAGFAQILATSLLAFLFSRALGYGATASLYFAVALTFASTIVIVKLLSEKNDLQSLYGRISIGVLLVQDFAAIVLLMFLAGASEGVFSPLSYLMIVVKALFLFLFVFLFSKKVLPGFFSHLMGGSTELLFIVSVAWALGLSALVGGPLGFSPEIGGFLAGLALSNLPEHFQIASRTKPLRDFFLTIFFLFLGTKFVFDGGLSIIAFPTIMFSLFVIIGHPLILMSVLGILGFKRKTSFMSGLVTAQISEFSLIIVSKGESLGHVGSREVSTIVLVGIISMTISTYLILNAEKYYKKLKNWLSVFEKKRTFEEAYAVNFDLKDHVVLVGSDRTGTAIVKHLKSRGADFVVVDHNPLVFKRLSADNVNVIFGDISDEDTLKSANIEKARLVISTTSTLEDNLTVLEFLKNRKVKLVYITTAYTKNEGVKLYEAGASYVIIPEVVAGDYLVHMLDVHAGRLGRIIEMGQRHFNKLIFK